MILDPQHGSKNYPVTRIRSKLDTFCTVVKNSYRLYTVSGKKVV